MLQRGQSGDVVCVKHRFCTNMIGRMVLFVQSKYKCRCALVSDASDDGACYIYLSGAQI